MKIGFYNYYKGLNNNRIFQSPTGDIGDDLLYSIYSLGQYLSSQSIQYSTIDMGNINSFNIVVFFDLPKRNDPYYLEVKKNNIPSYLFILESALIRPDNWKPENHKYFKKVFTWNSKLVDNKKYFQFYLPNKIPKELTTFETKSKFCTLIASNKFSMKRNELYSERKKAIRWFEKNHIDKFDLYGIGWEYGEPIQFIIPLIFLNNFTYNLYIKFLTIEIFNKFLKLFHKQYPSYRGRINSKRNTLNKYKFSICYENSINDDNYITEKIFDCFFAGCVPIYLGSTNIDLLLPKTTFIDKRNFNDYYSLFNYLINMSDSEYNNYQNEILKFLQSMEIKKFSSDYFIELFQNIIINEHV